ncbi:hypothetical protein B0T14DRAFT_495122 [Immersiella caudata]|uniref:Uncharacterized protein n=1 Tax=Immersiella caudata TaxID=314043 RepID=A0AA39WYH1_9PEZI|nr:hypothetical protein B0T14DRAFT_495122 [Immersiella caudata]
MHIPRPRDLAIYRVNITEFATELVKLSADTKHNVWGLVHPDLPTHWYFGLSGICDFFADTPNPVPGPTANRVTRCRRAFPPNVDVLSVVHESLRGNIAPDFTESEKTHRHRHVGVGGNVQHRPRGQIARRDLRRPR